MGWKVWDMWDVGWKDWDMHLGLAILNDLQGSAHDHRPHEAP